MVEIADVDYVVLDEPAADTKCVCENCGWRGPLLCRWGDRQLRADTWRSVAGWSLPRSRMRLRSLSFLSPGVHYSVTLALNHPHLGKFARTAHEFAVSISSNAASLINYGERYRAGERISSCLAESRVNAVISRRFAKRQQMQWTKRGGHLLLQIGHAHSTARSGNCPKNGTRDSPTTTRRQRSGHRCVTAPRS